MKRKKLLTGAPARLALMNGAKTLADAVKLTLGPFSLHAAIEKGDEVIDDGVTVAREIVSGCIHDEIEQRGARMLLQVATKTEDITGDGTSTSIILGYETTKEASKFLDDGKSMIGKKTSAEVVQTIEEERKEVTKKLIAMAKPIKNEKHLIEVATVSATDPELGRLIGSTQFDLGPEGLIIAEETAERECSVQRVHGVRIDNGFGTSLLMNNQEKQSLEIGETRVLLTNFVMHDLTPIQELGKSLARSGVRSLVIVARAFGEQAIRDCLANIEKGFSIFPVNAPYTDMNEIMKDLSAVLGARYINTEDSTLEAVQMSDIGFAQKIVARRYDAVITGKEDDKIKVRVDKRIAELTESLKGTVSDFSRKHIESRIAQLTNGFAIVKVGATSEIRRKYLKRKADDAVGATRAALQEGVVAGGGLAFKKISDDLPDGYILKAPLTKIHEQIMNSSPKGFKIEAHVQDSLKVLRVALEQACSVASTFANAGIAIAEEKQRDLDFALQKLANTSQGENQ